MDDAVQAAADLVLDRLGAESAQVYYRLNNAADVVALRCGIARAVGDCLRGAGIAVAD